MTYLLYPQLPRKTAIALADARCALSVQELVGSAASSHGECIYSATGGSRIQQRQLEQLADAARSLRDEAGSRTEHDASLARLLHRRMHLSRAEASKEGTWCFLGCVLLPDLVRWRFESTEATPTERFLGASRGIRNAIGRCWWRGELLNDPHPPAGRDNYWLLDELSEDELTGILERQRAVSSRRLAVALARALVSADTLGLARMDIARDAFKRFLRLGYFVAFDALEDTELSVACESLYMKSARALKATARK